MARPRTALAIVSVTLLGLTGCGGSATPPAAAPAPAPATTTQGGTTNVASQGSNGSGGFGDSIATERRAARKSLRKWGRAATRACRKLDDLQAPYGRRFRAMADDPKRTSIAEGARVFKAYAKIAEREYDLVREVPLPSQAEAVDAIDSFLQKEEEALMLLQRTAVELDARNDPGSLIRTAARGLDLLDDYRRAAKAVHAEACYD